MPTAPLAYRPGCPGRLVWTRPLRSRSAQRLHASKPCHAVSHGTLHTLQKYRKEKYKKKIPIFWCNNVLQELGGCIRAQYVWHRLWTRANPTHVFLVPPPLAPYDPRRSLHAWTRTASTRSLMPAHTLPHGRLQRTDGPSSMDHGLRDQSLAPPLPPFTQAAASATPGLQPAWGSPATLHADLVGAWFGTRVQRKRDRHGTPSTLAVQSLGTPASTASQTPGLGSGGGDDGDGRTHNFFSTISPSFLASGQHMDTLVLAADQTYIWPSKGNGN
jgi:hypothetical protein